MGIGTNILRASTGIPFIVAGLGSLFNINESNPDSVVGRMSGLLAEDGLLGRILKRFGLDNDLIAQIGQKAAGPLLALIGAALTPGILGSGVRKASMSIAAVAVAFVVAQGFFRDEFNSNSFAGFDLGNTLDIASDNAANSSSDNPSGIDIQKLPLEKSSYVKPASASAEMLKAIAADPTGTPAVFIPGTAVNIIEATAEASDLKLSPEKASAVIAAHYVPEEELAGEIVADGSKFAPKGPEQDELALELDNE